MNDSRESHPVRVVLSQILSDGIINDDQVRELEQFVAEDWVVDQDEVELLFRVNQAIHLNDEACQKWSEFFVSSVGRLVVMDMNSPGQIDEEEGNWLAEMLDKYAVGNETEKQLFFDLRNTTSSIEGKLSELIQSFE